MFIGGCAGSTGGGMKVIRLFVLIKALFAEIVRVLHPQAIVPVRVGKATVNRNVLTNILVFFTLFLFSFVLGVLIMTALGLDHVTAFGSVAATLGNIGPGLGNVGPTDNYAHIPVMGKWVLALLMLMGRLELFTVIILLSPNFWKR